MILKVFDDRRNQEGWRFIDGVHEVHVDISTWALARGDEEHTALICAKMPDTGTEESAINRDHRMIGREFVFDYEPLFERFESENDHLSVKVITARFGEDDYRGFVTKLDTNSWLLNDAGKTVERL